MARRAARTLHVRKLCFAAQKRFSEVQLFVIHGYSRCRRCNIPRVIESTEKLTTKAVVRLNF